MYIFIFTFRLYALFVYVCLSFVCWLLSLMLLIHCYWQWDQIEPNLVCFVPKNRNLKRKKKSVTDNGQPNAIVQSIFIHIIQYTYCSYCCCFFDYWTKGKENEINVRRLTSKSIMNFCDDYLYHPLCSHMNVSIISVLFQSIHIIFDSFTFSYRPFFSSTIEYWSLLLFVHLKNIRLCCDDEKLKISSWIPFFRNVNEILWYFCPWQSELQAIKSVSSIRKATNEHKKWGNFIECTFKKRRLRCVLIDKT